MRSGLRARATSVLVALMLLAAGAAIAPAIGAVNDPDARLHAAAKVLAGDFDFFFVESSGFVADMTFISMSKAGGPTPLAVRLGVAMVNANAKAEPLAVSGPSDAKTEQVIKDALRSTGKDSLSRLQLVYVGKAATAKALKKIVEKRGARFTYVPY